MGFNRFNIGTRIWIGFAALILLSLSLAGFGVYQLSSVGRETGAMDYLAGRVARILDATRRPRGRAPRRNAHARRWRRLQGCDR